MESSDISINLKLDCLDKYSFEEVRIWRNKLDNNILRTPFKLTKEMQENFYNDEICNRKSKHRYLGLYEFKEDYFQIIACIGIINIEWENRLGEISLIVNPAYTNIGYGKIAFLNLLTFGFNNLNLENIFGECYECSPHVGFWEKMIKKFHGQKTILYNRKYYNLKYYNSLYFNFNKQNFYLDRTIKYSE